MDRHDRCGVCRGLVRHHLTATGMCPAAPYIAELEGKLDAARAMIQTARDGLEHQGQALREAAEQARQARDEIRRL